MCGYGLLIYVIIYVTIRTCRKTDYRMNELGRSTRNPAPFNATFVCYQQKHQDRQFTYNVTLSCVRVTFVAAEKQCLFLHIMSVSTVLVIQHAQRMRHTVICGLSVSTIFFHIYHKLHDFRRKVIKHKICFDYLYNFCIKHFSFWEYFSEILS
jgi:hypothetical protein